eukprot:353138-Chlamydomonas_euryale.AAC.7
MPGLTPPTPGHSGTCARTDAGTDALCQPRSNERQKRCAYGCDERLWTMAVCLPYCHAAAAAAAVGDVAERLPEVPCCGGARRVALLPRHCRRQGLRRRDVGRCVAPRSPPNSGNDDCIAADLLEAAMTPRACEHRPERCAHPAPPLRVQPVRVRVPPPSSDTGRSLAAPSSALEPGSPD